MIRGVAICWRFHIWCSPTWMLLDLSHPPGTSKWNISKLLYTNRARATLTCNLERATCIPKEKRMVLKKRASANMWLQHQGTLSFHPFILLQALRAPCRGQHRCGSGASEATDRWSRVRCGQQDAQNQAQPVSSFWEFKDFNGWSVGPLLTPSCENRNFI